MKRLFTLALLTIILASFVLPTMAQEATAEATQEAPAPDVTVVVEAPAEDASQFELLVPVFGLMMLLGLLVQSVLLYRSTPPENKEQVRAEILKQVREIIAESKRVAQTTPSSVDNRAVDAAEALVDFFDRPEAPAAATEDAVG